ncbi:M12 family metallo-peptidase [Emticicia sp. W12TSBA100-4]|uniref:M12 family metallo-peptidase n=1 Tax=Emticicia sp. W12TSBA100-4 TaxID=3160965 RepID=UPI00330605A3
MLKVFSTFILLFVTSFAFSQESKVPLCGTPDSQILDAKVLERMRNAGKNSNLRMADLPMLECLVAVAVEYKIYLDYNKNQDLIKEKVYQYFDKVSKVYEDEMKIKLTVNHIEVITTQRGDTLQESKKKLGYHIAHLFTLGNAIPNFASGITFKIINSDGSYDIYCISGNFNDEKVVVNTMAHELGHGFDCPHTHNCNWPNGPIDYCGMNEGECLKDSYLMSIGTIMSYCQSSGFTFNPLCREVIRNRADEILSKIQTAPNRPKLSTKSPANFTTEPYLEWNSNVKTTKYEVQLSTNQSFTNILIDSITNFNLLQVHSLEKGKAYYWRIKSINSFGESDWSEINEFLCAVNESLSVPAIKGVFLDKDRTENVRLEVYPVNEAVSYEFRITDQYNYLQFGFNKTQSNNVTTFKVQTPYFVFNELNRPEFYSDFFFWQVRALRNNIVGEWSTLRKFERMKPISRWYPTQTSKTNTTFPIIWEVPTSSINREYILEVSESEDFKTNIFQQSRLLNVIGSVGNFYNLGYEVIENLKPNTTYFYRFKEKNVFDSWQMSSFKTGVKNSKWKFLNQLNSPYKDGLLYFTNDKDSSNIYFVNTTGLYKTDGVNWTEPLNSISTKGFLNPEVYTYIKSDFENNLYFNQTKVGLVKYDGNTISPLSNTIASKSQKVNVFTLDLKGNLYTVMQNDSGYFNIYKYSSGVWSSIPFFSRGKIYSPNIYIDSRNNLWASTFEDGIYKYDGKNWISIESKNPFTFYTTFIVDTKENLWWINGFDNSVNRRNSDNTIRKFSASPFNGDLPNGQYRNLFSDRFGTIWLLGEVNQKVVLYKFINDKWIRVDFENDLPLPLRFISDYKGIAVDRQNRFWLFTNSFGIFIYDDSGQVKSQTINAEKILNQRNTTKPFKIIANVSSNLPLSYKIVSGPAKIKKDSITLTGEVGKVTLQISQPGNEIYEPAKNVELSFEVTAKASQTITFAKIEQKTLAERTFTLSATTTSGLPTTYQIISGPATVNANVVTLTGTGKVAIKAKQEGNAEFLAANEVIQEFCVIPAKPIISVNAANNWILEVNADKNLQWYFNGTKVENGTKSTLLVTQNGQYKVEVFNSDATCASNTSDTFQLLILANEDDKSQTINVFPNPADDWVTVDSEKSLKINSVKLYDLKGSLLYTNEKSELPHKIKIHSSWQGNVLLEIKTNDKTYLKKLVLN